MASLKTAFDNTLKNNERSMRHPVDIDPGKPPRHEGREAWKSFAKMKREVLDRAFDRFDSSSEEEQSFIREHFSSRDYESGSPLLQKYAEAGHVPSGATLRERAKGIIGGR